jgi:WbqC-like protein family
VKLAIMQPYFFPYLGHFALISHCEKWVVFDITQYTPKSWMSRNRVLHPRKGWNYVSVPLANASISIKTAQAEILSFAELAPSLLGKLSHYRKRAPFYAPVERLIEEIFSMPTDSLVALNVRALDAVCRYLGIRFNHALASESDLALPAIDHPGGWAPAISRSLDATEYINPISGRSIFRQVDFDAAGVALKFLHFRNFVYRTDPYQFEEGLSILDVMMWNEPAVIREAIASHSCITDARESLETRLSPQ